MGKVSALKPVSGHAVLAPSKVSVVALNEKVYPYCLVLVNFRNRFERDFKKVFLQYNVDLYSDNLPSFLRQYL